MLNTRKLLNSRNFCEVCIMSFAKQLIQWYTINKRDLPWRQTQDPYFIWLSEIILQQTRVDQGMPYYYRFVEQFPTVQTLALAEEGFVLRLWEGLGYYSRARNLLKAAQRVVDQWGGEFPAQYEELIQLPGVGPYTAAAISSFSSGEARAVVDGNVYRVLSRYFGVDLPINRPIGQKYFARLAQDCLDQDDPATYNQAIMEFGALQCKPVQPLCSTCPVAQGCRALATNSVMNLPVKEKNKKVRDRYFHYFIVEGDQSMVLQQRSDRDIWAHMFEFPLLETEGPIQPFDLLKHPKLTEWFGEKFSLEMLFHPVQHLLSHQKIHATFYKVEGFDSSVRKKYASNYVLLKDLDTLAKPKVIYAFLKAYLS
jgi:A/G-specific adenine glycosylase